MGLTERLAEQALHAQELQGNLSAVDLINLQLVEPIRTRRRKIAKEALAESEVEQLLIEVEGLIPGSSLESLEWDEKGRSSYDDMTNISGEPLSVGFVLSWDRIVKKMLDFPKGYEKGYNAFLRDVAKGKGIIVESRPDGHIVIRGDGAIADLFHPTRDHLDDALEGAYESPLTVYQTPQIGDVSEFDYLMEPFKSDPLRDAIPEIGHKRNINPEILMHHDSSPIK